MISEAVNDLVIWGASGHALVVADIVRKTGDYRIVGFLDDNPGRQGRTFCGATIFGGQESLTVLRNRGVNHLIVAVGDNTSRLKLAEQAMGLGFVLATAVHPGASLAGDVQVRPGAAVMAGVVVNAACSIGANVILNTSSSIDHECVIGDGVHIGPGVVMGGGVIVGRATWIGIGAVIKDHVRIGAGTVIGAGAVVLNDISDGVTAYGLPARVVASKEE